jgi:predicted RNA polymerase sigma factor
MVGGPRAGLARLDELSSDPRLTGDHRLHSVRGHLLELAGDTAAAVSCYDTAARLTASRPQQRYLHARAARLRT